MLLRPVPPTSMLIVPRADDRTSAADPGRHRDGTVTIDDEDEFDEHSVALHHPGDVIDSARRAADDVFAALSVHAPPFASPPTSWLDAANNRVSALDP
jgi:hypothetical protein